MNHVTHICVTHLTHSNQECSCMTWRPKMMWMMWRPQDNMCDMTHSYMWHDWFKWVMSRICVWLIRIGSVYVCHGDLRWCVWWALKTICVTWLMSYVTHNRVALSSEEFCVWHDNLRWCVWLGSWFADEESVSPCVYWFIRVTWLIQCVTWLIQCVTWLIHMCDMNADEELVICARLIEATCGMLMTH